MNNCVFLKGLSSFSLQQNKVISIEECKKEIKRYIESETRPTFDQFVQTNLENIVSLSAEANSSRSASNLYGFWLDIYRDVYKSTLPYSPSPPKNKYNKDIWDEIATKVKTKREPKEEAEEKNYVNALEWLESTLL